ncbi:hypothetical protein L1D61_26785 [Vibrio mediterranei]|uniref:Uncharacterized protein n=1 Tax=Vibrio mediterranei TaxID=689 RepID=A0A3G4VJU9_9VIBR|nr:hypothetical protein [Vibrio mediterranei]AYV25094.1 hypothetical protein ECB94_27795 [Vibrio mediterranei]MCG9790731.1 hypothetical protein [Vibrio mediterranei]
MIANNLTNALLNGIEKDTPQVNPQNVEAYLATINKSQKDLKKNDPAIALLDKQPADPEVLIMVAANQKQVALSMVSSNPNSSIALALMASIEAYSKKLIDIQRWTEGGKGTFEVMLNLMFEDITSKQPLSTEDHENLLQILVLDLMVKAKEYGLSEWMNETQTRDWTSHILEVVGSGNHSTHPSQPGWGSPADIANSIKNFLNAVIIKAKDLPPDSLASQIIRIFENEGISKIADDIEANFYNDHGSIVDGGKYSPMLRLSIMSELMLKTPLSQEEVEIVLKGSKGDVDKLVKDKTGVDTGIDFLVQSPNSNWVVRTDPDPNIGVAVDYVGHGIDNNVLVSLYTNFPPRKLTEEEIKEVNRIGDQVKMIQQTLKYWLQICRDERMAMARNI